MADWESLLTQLHDGLDRIQNRLTELESKNQELVAQRESLEAQVMNFAQEPEIPADWWDKVTFIFAEEGEEHWMADEDTTEMSPIA